MRRPLVHSSFTWMQIFFPIASLIVAAVVARRSNPLEFFILLAFLMLIWLFGIGRSMSRLEVDDTTLYAARFGAEVRIPLADVVEVSQFGSAPAVITLARPSGFGRKVRFVPAETPLERLVRAFVPWRTNAVVRDLRARAASARTQS